MSARGIAVLLLALVLTGCGQGDEVGADPSSAPPTANRPPVAPAVQVSELPAADGCPATFDVASGSAPRAQGVDTAEALLPDEVPSEVRICAYPPRTRDSTTVELESERRLSGPLDDVPADLGLPLELVGNSRICAAGFTGPQPTHLLRASYGRGRTAWIAPQFGIGCNGLTNGRVATASTVDLAASFAAGRWVSPVPLEGYCPGLTGRGGQERALVPDGWSTVRGCDDDLEPFSLTRDQGDRLVAQLADLPPSPMGNGIQSCSSQATPSAGGRGRARIVFDYPVGRSVEVWLQPGCPDTVHNLSLEARVSEAQLATLVSVLDESPFVRTS